MGGIVRVPGLPGCAGCELGGDGLAEDEGTRRPRQRDAGGVGPGPMAGVGAGAIRGRHVAGVHDVLDADGDAVKQAAPRAPIEGAGRRDGLLGIEMLPSAHDRLALGDAGEIGARQRLDGETTALDALCGLEGGEMGQVGHRDPRSGSTGEGRI